MEGKTNGKRGRGWSRATNLGNMKKLLFLLNYKETKTLVDKRED